MKRERKQSQLDYLWVNYGSNPEFRKIERKGNQLIGYNDKGLELFQIDYSGPLSGSSNEVVDFGIEGNQYYIELSNGTRLTASIESPDLSELRLITETNNQALQIINGDGEGSLKEILRLSKEYTDSKIVNLDVSKLQEQLDDISQGLLKLNGPAEEEGSVLNIVNSSIESALEWENIN